MENMRFKVGDRVRIKNFDWYNENKDEDGNIRYQVIDSAHPIFFTKYMSRFCGETLTIICVHKGLYHMNETGYSEFWTDEMIEGLVEEETYEFLKTDKTNLPSLNDFMDMLNNEISLPEGYQFVDENGNVINATKIVLEKKKKEYPKTYDECCKVLSLGEDGRLYTKGYKASLIQDFQKLIICRDAYWKIAGEEMGLGKPWVPDWKNSEERRYSIVNIEGDINLPEKTLTKWILKVTNKILVFPTEEMRDAFYENFKSEIEICKEFL